VPSSTVFQFTAIYIIYKNKSVKVTLSANWVQISLNECGRASRLMCSPKSNKCTISVVPSTENGLGNSAKDAIFCRICVYVSKPQKSLGYILNAILGSMSKLTMDGN
jgi:hypothetical protein